MKVILISILIGLLVIGIGMLLVVKHQRSEAMVNKRMRDYLTGEQLEEETAAPAKTLRERFLEVVHEMAQFFEKSRDNRSLDLKMERAGLPLLGSEFIVISLIVGAVAGAAVFLVTMDMPLGAIGLAGGVLSCWIYLSVQTSRRQTLFANQLGDTLTMVANALRAGFSFMQAMDLIAKEMPNPMGEEFHRVVQDIQVGSTQDDALERMAQRVGSADFNLVVTAVGIQRQVGGNLSYILDTISVTINDRIKMKREAKTLTSQGRASGMVLVALPFALAGILRFMDPTYFDPMLEHPLGPMIIGGSIVWMIIGIIAIQRIVDIDV